MFAPVVVKSNGNFIAECAVRSPSKSVAVILADTIASLLLFHDRMVAKTSVMRNTLPVLPSATITYNPPL